VIRSLRNMFCYLRCMGKPEGIVQKHFRRLNGTTEVVLFPFFTKL